MGLRIAPCRTPLETQNLLEKEPFQATCVKLNKYICSNNLIMTGGSFLINNRRTSLQYSTRSNALMKRANTV